MDYTPNLTDEGVLSKAVKTLDKHMPLTANGYVCRNEDLWRVLLGACAKHTTISGYCDGLVEGPSGTIVRQYVNACFEVEDLTWIEAAFNAALAETIPRRVFKAARDTAMDTHDQAYYGKSEQDEGLWIRAAAKDGTTRFYRVATAYVIWGQIRVTLAVKFVRPEDDPAGIVSTLLERLKAVKYRVKTLFLDRGFGGVKVLRFLQATRVRTVIAITIRGKQGGTRALCRGRASYVAQHRFHGDDGDFIADLAVCRTFTTARRTGRHSRRAQWMIFCMIGCRFSPAHVRQAYRRRFGIESSYRCARQIRAKTTSPNPALRFLLIALSFFLVNLWIALRWAFAQIRCQGGRQVLEAYFRLQRLIDCIVAVLDRLYRSRRSFRPLSLPIE